MARPFLDGVGVIVDAVGTPVSNGTVEFFRSPGSDPAEVFDGPSLQNTLGVAVALNAIGRTQHDVWFDPLVTYKAVVKDALGVQVQVIDPVDSALDVSSAVTLPNFAALEARTWGDAVPLVVRLATNYAAGDNGGEFCRDDADSASASNGVTIGVDQDGNRWKRNRIPGEADLRWGGVRFDGTNEQAKVDMVVAACHGENCSLFDNKVVVTAIPDGMHFYDGGWSEGGIVYECGPRRHSPWDGPPPLVVHEAPNKHFWDGQGCWLAASDTILASYIESASHGPEKSAGAEFRWETSRDGVEFSAAGDPIYSHLDYEPRFPVGALVSPSRFMVAWQVSEPDGDIVGQHAAYTDDAGLTNTRVDIPTPYINNHSACMNASGHVLIYGHGGNDIMMTKCVNPLATTPVFSAPVVVGAATGAFTTPREGSFVHIGGDKIIGGIRNNAGGFMGFQASDDGGDTHTPITLSGLQCGANPPKLTYAWGRVYVYLTAQNGDAIDGRQDRALYAVFNARALHQAIMDGTPLPVPTIHELAALGQTNIGYMLDFQIRKTQWMGYVTTGETGFETVGVNSARVVRLGGPPVELPPFAILKNRRLRPPIGRNPQMRFNTRAGTYSGITSATKTLDSHRVTSSGASIAITQVENSEALQRLLGGKGRYSMRAVSGSGGSGRLFEYARIYGRDAIEEHLDQIHNGAAKIVNVAGFPAYVRFGATLNAGGGGTGGGTGETQDALFSTLPSGCALVRGLFKTPAEASVSVWGSDPFLSYWMLSNDVGAMDAIIAELYGDRGAHYIPLSADDYDASRDRADLHVQARPFGSLKRIGVASSIVADYALLNFTFRQMARTPEITLPAASTIEQYSGGADRSPTSIAAQGVTSDRFTLQLNKTGVVAYENHVVRAASGQTATFLMDAE